MTGRDMSDGKSKGDMSGMAKITGRDMSGVAKECEGKSPEWQK